MQKVLYITQNVRLKVGCAKSALYNTKCTLDVQCTKKMPFLAQNVRLGVLCT